jgi:hypothetical protein
MTSMGWIKRRPARALHYGLPTRLTDKSNGWRDGGHGLAFALSQHPVGAGDEPTSWLRANLHTCAERMSTQELIAHEGVRPQIEAYREARAHLGQLDERIRRLQEEADAFPPLSERDASIRAATEANLTEQEVSARRIREHDTLIQPTRAALATAIDQRQQTLADMAALEASIATAWETMVIQQGRIREYHRRRDHTYRCAFLRALPTEGSTPVDRTQVMAALAQYDPPSLSPVDCPWMPSAIMGDKATGDDMDQISERSEGELHG